MASGHVDKIYREREREEGEGGRERKRESRSLCTWMIFIKNEEFVNERNLFT